MCAASNLMIVADAGLCDPAVRTVGLDRFKVDLWIAHSDPEQEMVKDSGAPIVRAAHRGMTVGAAMAYLSQDDPAVTKDDVLFLVRRRKFVGRFTAGSGTTCGEWTRVVNAKGERGFFKASIAGGWCPVRCSFCYLLRIPFRFQSLALNVGEFAHSVAQERSMGRRRAKIPIINMGETGGLLEWAAEFQTPEIVQAYVDAALDAAVVPYLLTKRALPGLRLKGAHVGISLNPAAIMRETSPGASTPDDLLDFLADAREQGASTVIRWGPVISGHDAGYEELAQAVHRRGLIDRFTVDLLRFTDGHPATPAGFEFRAHKWQEAPDIQLGHLQRVREFFPDAAITGCKLDPAVAKIWVKRKIIQAMPCACWA